jgi:putative ABC transport system permease protein
MWTRLSVLLSRVLALFTGRRLDRDFNDELQTHLAMLTEENVRRGLSPAEAARQASLRLGGVAQLEERNRDERSLPFLETTTQDLRFAIRTLKKNPAYASVAIATLAIGIGAGTTVYSLAGAVLLRPLPYADPSRLVRVFETNPLRNWTRNIASPANYADWKAQSTSFTDLAAYEQFNSVGSGATDVFLTGFGEPQALKSLGVTGNLFRVLETSPLMGRTFTDEETFDGKARVAVLSYGAWQGLFAADPGIIGKSVVLSGRTTTVVGVMPRNFFFPGRDVQIWVPVGYAPTVFVRNRRPHYLGVIARRKPGVSLEQASQEMDAIARRLEQQYPDTNTKMGVRLEHFHSSLAFEPRPALLMLSGAVGVLFLIVCANLASLQLGRAAVRTRELAIRRALGAARTRLVRQLITESLVLSVVGGALGFALVAAARVILLRYASTVVPLFADLRLDRSVVLFDLALSLAAPVLFGVLPALTSSKTDTLAERSASSSRDMSWARSMLVAAEVALSIVLVVGAVLLTRSLARLQQVDPGFNQNNVVAFTLTLPPARYPGNLERLRAYEAIEQQLREQPGVEAVGAGSTIALRGFTWTGDTTIEGRSSTDYERDVRHKSITPDYFKAMGIRLVAGRMVDERDTIDQPRVAIINEAAARRFFRGENALGRRITFGRPQDNAPWITVVGIVADEKQDGLDKEAQAVAYQGIRQAMSNPMTFVVRTAVDPDAAVASARQRVWAVDKDLALTSTTTLKAVVDESMGDHRFRTALLSAFAGVALFLAALGIYGVLAYFVSQRSRELGIRLALGAHPRAVFRLVVGQGLRPVVAGAAVGVGGALAVTSLAQSLLFGVQPIDPITYSVAIALLATIAAIACAVPAMRAMRVDPLVALRDE